MMRTRLVALACCCLVLGGLRLAAQPPAPKPGPEHELLKKFAGDWDCTVSFQGQESKATAKSRMILGGFWMVEDFKGEFFGAPFAGRGTTGYDPAKKKYVSTWIDSMTPTLLLMEGNFDKDHKTFRETGEGGGPDGKKQKMKNVYEFKDDNTIVFTMYMVADGKDQEAFKITYHRKK
jgi:hypothetical protein